MGVFTGFWVQTPDESVLLSKPKIHKINLNPETPKMFSESMSVDVELALLWTYTLHFLLFFVEPLSATVFNALIQPHDNKKHFYITQRLTPMKLCSI